MAACPTRSASKACSQRLPPRRRAGITNDKREVAMTTKKRADGTDKPETSQTRPTARGFKRNLVLVGVMLFVCVFIALGLAWWAGSGGKKGSEPTSSLGPISPNGTGEVRRELSPAMQEKQNRVFQDEAEAARKQG